jgi:DNA-directed RNA polymerase beta' subunit
MHPLASEVIKGCIPRGQRKPFPANCMSLMTVSGAKGSTVNFSQIACLLGQQVRSGWYTVRGFWSFRPGFWSACRQHSMQTAFMLQAGCRYCASCMHACMHA